MAFIVELLRREFFDHVLIWNAVDLGRKLEEFRDYYNEHCVHQSLGGRNPGEQFGQPPLPMPCSTTTLGSTIFGGPFQMPIGA